MLTDFLYSKSENNIIAAVVTDKNNKLFALAMDRDRAFLSPWVKRHYTEMAPSLVNERKNNEDIFYNIFKSNLPVISIGSKINNKGTNVGNLFFLLDFNKIKNKLLPCQSKAIDVNIFTMEEFISNDIWMTKNVKISGDIVMSFKYGAKLLIVDDLWILIAVSILLFIVVLILKKTNFVFMWNSINLINPFSKELDESARNDLYKYAETLRISCKYANRPKLLD
ncbi:MAG: hypothetical protein GY874_09875 [Desulfobacteraceae bacterium]|nr:hypothetical protein [Desulfobacteraceae bacterium]